VLECKEGRKLIVPGGGGNVLRAWFGDPEKPWEDGDGCGQECTEVVAKRLKMGNGAVVASNACLGGYDPAPGVFKHLLVEVKSQESGGMVEEASGPRIFESPDEVQSPRWVAFVRHAQAGHNVDKELVMRPDNPLTAEGKAQAQRAGEGAAGAAARAAELVITTPLMRAMQTTSLILGPDPKPEARILIDVMGTERYAAPCDEGSPPGKLRAELPEASLAWEGWDTLPEKWWPEPEEDAYARVQAFMEMIRQRPEERIVCVGHGGFWEMVLDRYLDNCEVVYCNRSLSS